MQFQPLSGTTILELGEFISASYATRLLADLGADVIKVEPPGTGDKARRCGPFLPDASYVEQSGLFLYLNSNKLGITLDIESASGYAILKDLIMKCDVLVENISSSKLAAIKVDYDTLHGINSNLIVTSISPFGRTGPYRDYQGGDLISFHMGGVGYMTPGQVRNLDREPPIKPNGHLADFLAGLTAAVATMEGLFLGEEMGTGVHLDVSEQEAVATLVILNFGEHSVGNKVTGRTQSATQSSGLVSVFPCKDGYFAMSLFADDLWRRWLEGIERTQWMADERFVDRASRVQNWDSLEPLIREWTMERTKDEITTISQAKRIPVLPTNRIDEVVNSEHLRARGFFVELEHAEVGRMTCPGSPYKVSSGPGEVRRLAPLLGQDNEKVLCGRLGYSKQQLAGLRQCGVI